MTPTPQEHTSAGQEILTTPVLDDNRIVISGMSGLYPQSRNVQELSEILYNKVNPVSKAALRFKYNHPEVVQQGGTIPELEFFDAQFFKVHYRLGNVMDPMARKILEQSYQAIYDAGVNPEELSGKKVGVYIGSCFSESEKAFFYEGIVRSGFGIAGSQWQSIEESKENEKRLMAEETNLKKKIKNEQRENKKKEQEKERVRREEERLNKERIRLTKEKEKAKERHEKQLKKIQEAEEKQKLKEEELLRKLKTAQIKKQIVELEAEEIELQKKNNNQ